MTAPAPLKAPAPTALPDASPPDRKPPDAARPILANSWWASGLNLRERLSGAPAPADLDRDARAARRLGRWRDEHQLEQTGLFQRRLDAIGVTPLGLAALLVEAPAALAGRTLKPAWAATAEQILADLPAEPDLGGWSAGRLWGAGFLPSAHQGVRFRAGSAPVLYLDDPPGVSKPTRRAMLDAVKKLDAMKQDAYGDPEIETRIAQYEMAYRMQTSVPELMDLSKEPDSVFELYGPDSRKPGSYAANCLMARRLAERNVRFIQLYHRGWDQHFNLPRDMALQCQGTDQASAALVTDLKQRGLLDDTLVVWGGEFGRTVFCQGKLMDTNYGRDHHPRNFCMWVAGGGTTRGAVLGETDDFSYNVVSDPVSVHDLQATILHLLGIDHTRLTYRFQGRDFRLTDVDGEVAKKLLA